MIRGKSKKIAMIFAVLALSVLIIYINTPAVYAGLLDGARGESGHRPNPPTPPDDQTNPPTEDIEVSKDIVETVYHYTGISGNVYEIIGDVLKKDSFKDNDFARLGIGGVIVELQPGNHRVITSSDGNYSFDNLQEGTYSLKFIYGMLDGNSYSNKRNILKYNGYDYKAAIVPGETTYTTYTTAETEVKYAGKGCVQVILAIDCSASVRNTTVEIDGEEKTKMQVITDSSKKLVHALLSSGKNIYVGIVAFSGTSYLAQGITKNEDILLEHLDYINENDWYTANTDLVTGLNTATNGFADITGESNKHIIVLSDGVPTADGIEYDSVYCEDSDIEVYEKLERIKNRTIEEIAKIKNKGIKIDSIYIDPNDEEEKQYILDIFNGHVDYFKVMNEDEFIKELTDQLETEVYESTEEHEYEGTTVVDAGKEDKERRIEVDKNFSQPFYYNADGFSRAKLFEQIEAEYSYNQTEASKLSELTWMVVDGGTYNIDKSGGGEIIKWDEPVEEEGEEPIHHVIIHVDVQYSNRDLGLVQRPVLELSLKLTATGARITTAKGHTLFEETREIGTIEPIKDEADDELLWGTEIDVEYTIEISNKSAWQCNYLELIAYLPKDFSYDNTIKLVSENDASFAYSWEKVNPAQFEQLKNEGKITQDTYNAHKNEIAIKVLLENNGTSDSFYIAPGGSRKVKFIATRVTSGELNMCKEDTMINAEILGYSDNVVDINGDEIHRRMAVTSAKKVGGFVFQNLKGIFPGNNKEQDYTTTTNSFCVLPVLGQNKNNIIYIICGVLVLTIISGAIIAVKHRRN